jgi:hypothetical protein
MTRREDKGRLTFGRCGEPEIIQRGRQKPLWKTLWETLFGSLHGRETQPHGQVGKIVSGVSRPVIHRKSLNRAVLAQLSTEFSTAMDGHSSAEIYIKTILRALEAAEGLSRSGVPRDVCLQEGGVGKRSGRERLVPRPRFELGTPAFSGPCSTY